MKEWDGRRGGSIELRLEPDKRSQPVGKIASLKTSLVKLGMVVSVSLRFSQDHQGTEATTMICNYDLTTGGFDKCWMLLKKSKNVYVQKGKCFATY